MAIKFKYDAILDDEREDYLVPTGTSLPASGVNGEMFFVTGTLTLYVYYAGWNAIGSGTPPSGTTGQPIGLLLALTYPT